MSDPTGLPVLGQEPRERRDAARNRALLLETARRLVRDRGPDSVTMDAVAEAAGVGKGTVFRRFGSRAGLMGALVDDLEKEWQAAVMSGPPPLGPGAPPYQRLIAFGRSRIDLTLTHAALIDAAGKARIRSFAAWSFTAMHVRHLLAELEFDGDRWLFATYLLAPLEMETLRQQTDIESMQPEQIHEGWVQLVERILH